MAVQAIRDAHNLKPFQPFTIRTTAGDTYEVTHPEAMMQSEGGKSIVLRRGREGFAMLDVTNIASLEYGKTRKRANGAG